MKKKLFLILLSVITLVFSSCGPSEQEIATMTASAWTSTPSPTATPTPTPTATPVPYDLSVKVMDAEGNPIASASVTIAGHDTPGLTNESGEAAWTNLPTPDSPVEVAAPGYFASSRTFSLSRGPNNIAIALERDPNGLLASQACATGESLLYIEDFQDDSAAGWDEIDLHAQGWNIAEHPEEPGNKTAVSSTQDQSFTVMRVEDVFENAVWRIRYRIDGNRWVAFNWMLTGNYDLDGQHIDDSRYQIVLRPNGSDTHRITMPILNLGADLGSPVKLNVWHIVEIGGYQGQVEVWIDGKQWMSYLDPKPLPGGTIGIELFGPPVASGTMAYFDNMSVCSLSAPFTSMYSTP